MKVRATRLGYYDLKRRYPGDDFTLKAGDKPGSWMELVDGGSVAKGKAKGKGKPAPEAEESASNDDEDVIG